MARLALSPHGRESLSGSRPRFTTPTICGIEGSAAPVRFQAARIRTMRHQRCQAEQRRNEQPQGR